MLNGTGAVCLHQLVNSKHSLEYKHPAVFVDPGTRIFFENETERFTRKSPKQRGTILLILRKYSPHFFAFKNIYFYYKHK